jgi:hypothetical protein
MPARRRRAAPERLGYNDRDDGIRRGRGGVTVARYRIVHWRDIPSLVEAVDGAGTARVQLSPRFQDLIDALAMREGATESDAYLDGWGQGPEQDRPGSAEAVARAVAGELEEGFQALLMERFLPRP